jgi:hypothetical protein
MSLVSFKGTSRTSSDSHSLILCAAPFCRSFISSRSRCMASPFSNLHIVSTHIATVHTQLLHTHSYCTHTATAHTQQLHTHSYCTHTQLLHTHSYCAAKTHVMASMRDLHARSASLAALSASFVLCFSLTTAPSASSASVRADSASSSACQSLTMNGARKASTKLTWERAAMRRVFSSMAVAACSSTLW